MARLERIERDMTRAREKIAEWQNKLKELDGLRTEQENLEIIHAVRALNMTRDELAAFISGGILPTSMQDKAAIPAARYSRRKREADAPDSDEGGGTDYSTAGTGFETESEDKEDEE